jgi:NTP pyrophosphatase (non-canonical NTP hydrolase)
VNSKDYVKKALRTESGKYLFSATGNVTPRIEHAIYGLVTEAGEMMDAIKKSKIYGKDLDTVNLIEEAGDLMWYLSLLSDELHVSFEDIWERNINKLKVRYPEKYTDENALTRDLRTERSVLEKKPNK